MSDSIDSPIIIDLPYEEGGKKYDEDIFARALQTETHQKTGQVESSNVTEYHLRILLHYPAVYVIHAEESHSQRSEPEYCVYVGETNDISQRTYEHLYNDPQNRDDWRLFNNHGNMSQYVITHPYFNKSLTLDIENQLMLYMSSVDHVSLPVNKRVNPQRDYYTHDRFKRIFSDIWLDLHRKNPSLFPAEGIILDSALFKASPFHKLSDEQLEAENIILSEIFAALHLESPDQIATDKTNPADSHLILVQGAAGTGKTVLLSHLFYRLLTQTLPEEDAPLIHSPASAWKSDDKHQDGDHASQRNLIPKEDISAYILVNHDEQIHVYNQIATKLGLQNRSGTVVLKPTEFLNRHSRKNDRHRALLNEPIDKADVLLVDEAHLLLTQGNRAYSGKSQLFDLLNRAKVVVAVFDPNQILQSSQRLSPKIQKLLSPADDSAANPSNNGNDDEPSRIQLDDYNNAKPLTVDVSHIRLQQQFRIDASPEVIAWLDAFTDEGIIGELPADCHEHAWHADDSVDTRSKPYDIRVFDSPVDLFDAIKKKAEIKADGCDGKGLSRLLATYDWEYTSKHKNANDPSGHWNVELHQDGTGTWRMGLGGGDGTDNTSHDRCFCQPWNYQLTDPHSHRKGLNKDQAWAEKPYTINEVGSTYTIQGFDLNYAGVIIGPSVQYQDGKVMFHPENSKNKNATNSRKDLGDFAEENLKDELNVLLKRGVHGLYLFAVNPQLQQRLMDVYEASKND
ncbi:DUF2075 domain-containing protein [Bifidobacterium bombi]|uniref:GIY-YIG domain-containing protein n=1 Tax=Bifidobacterium bombi DSM 19703 TaxID=1341695 RepID=A0A086BNF3_9BIFI|nr:hypothetical protein BBOMB_1313 [Bifidobacterium bombi DSM 19703]